MSLISQEASLVKALYFEGKKPLIIPHRGGRNIVPENTLHALENTFVEKFSHFETDLRMSKDGVIFLHHDKSFDRTTDVSCLLYTSPSPRDRSVSRMPSSA